MWCWILKFAPEPTLVAAWGCRISTVENAFSSHFLPLHNFLHNSKFRPFQGHRIKTAPTVSKTKISERPCRVLETCMKSFHKLKALERWSDIWDDRTAEITETETKWMQWKIAMEQCNSWHPSMGKRGLCMGSVVNAGVEFPTQSKSSNWCTLLFWRASTLHQRKKKVAM